MKQVKYIVNDRTPIVIPHYMELSQLPASLAEFEKQARKAMTDSGAAHAVYAVKRYTEADEIELVDFYDPPVCLDDEAFYERTDAEAREHPGCMIYAVHAHK